MAVFIDDQGCYLKVANFLPAFIAENPFDYPCPVGLRLDASATLRPPISAALLVYYHSEEHACRNGCYTTYNSSGCDSVACLRGPDLNLALRLLRGGQSDQKTTQSNREHSTNRTKSYHKHLL